MQFSISVSRHREAQSVLPACLLYVPVQSLCVASAVAVCCERGCSMRERGVGFAGQNLVETGSKTQFFGGLIKSIVGAFGGDTKYDPGVSLLIAYWCPPTAYWCPPTAYWCPPTAYSRCAHFVPVCSAAASAAVYMEPEHHKECHNRHGVLA